MYISFALMALIFLRQISIYKQPNKINYAPLILGIGAIASVIHFIVSDEHQSMIFVLKGSFIPFLVALMLYIIMNIMHQTQKAENDRVQKEFTRLLIEQISQLKSFTENLERRMVSYANEEKEVRERFASKFNEDIETLGKLLHNQQRFMEKFEDLRSWHEELRKLFIDFTEFKLPELDSMVHKHIEMLRITNKEHFDQIGEYLEDIIGTKENLQREMFKLQEQMQEIETMSEGIAKTITKETLSAFADIKERLVSDFVKLQSRAEALGTSLAESENKIEGIKTQSEFVIRQMVLVAKKMEELISKRERADEVMTKMLPLFEELERLQSALSEQKKSLHHIVLQFMEMKETPLKLHEEEIEEISHKLSEKLEDILESMEQKIEENKESVSESVRLLAKRAKLSSSYTDQE